MKYVASSITDVIEHLKERAGFEERAGSYGRRLDRAHFTGVAEGLRRAAEILENTTIEAGA